MCCTGRPVACSIRSSRSWRSQPERVSGWVETMISLIRYSRTASSVAVYGSGSITSPIASMPCSLIASSVSLMRICAASRTASS